MDRLDGRLDASFLFLSQKKHQEYGIDVRGSYTEIEERKSDAKKGPNDEKLIEQILIHHLRNPYLILEQIRIFQEPLFFSSKRYLSIFQKPYLVARTHIIFPGDSYICLDWTDRYYTSRMSNRQFIFVLNPTLNKFKIKKFKMTGSRWLLTKRTSKLIYIDGFPCDVTCLHRPEIR